MLKITVNVILYHFLVSLPYSILERLCDPTSQTLGMLSKIVGDFLQCIRYDLTVETGRHAKNVIVSCMLSDFNAGQRIMLSISNESKIRFIHIMLPQHVSLTSLTSMQLQCFNLTYRI